MEWISQYSDLDKCPFCGSETFYLKHHAEGTLKYCFHPDGSEGNNENMYNDLILTGGKRVYCFGCDAFLGNVETNKLSIPAVKALCEVERQQENKIIFLDTETTGLDPKNDEILQISIINPMGKILLNTYIKPENHTDWKDAAKVNNITFDMVKNAPTADKVAKEIYPIITNAGLMIAYGASFDWGFISELLKKYTDFNFEKVPEINCCMEKFAEFYGEWNEEKQTYRWKNLSFAASYLKIKWRGKAHGSLADTFMCKDVWDKINDGNNN